jgi:hypothetical protein
VYGRNPEVLKGFESISPNLGGAVGSLDDLDKLEDLASKHDVTVNCAHADHIEAVRAVLKGQKRRFEATETAPVLIHTSGTGALVDVSSSRARQ